MHGAGHLGCLLRGEGCWGPRTGDHLSHQGGGKERRRVLGAGIHGELPTPHLMASVSPGGEAAWEERGERGGPRGWQSPCLPHHLSGPTCQGTELLTTGCVKSMAAECEHLQCARHTCPCHFFKHCSNPVTDSWYYSDILCGGTKGLVRIAANYQVCLILKPISSNCYLNVVLSTALR